jgi:hypothetical protein
VLVSNAGENQACFDGLVHPTSLAIDEHTAFTVVGVVSAGGTCVFYQNGAVIGNAIGGVLTTMPNLAFFGAVGVFFSAFDFAELVFYENTALTGTRLAQMFEYFRGKYNLY